MNLINFLFIFLFSVHLWSNAVNLQYKNIQIVAAQKDEKIAKIIAINLDQDIADFQKKIGFYDDEKINILIAKNADEYLSWTKNHATIIEFSDAFYSNHDKVIYLKNIRNLHNLTKIRTIILHEYIHHFCFGIPMHININLAILLNLLCLVYLNFDNYFNKLFLNS